MRRREFLFGLAGLVATHCPPREPSAPPPAASGAATPASDSVVLAVAGDTMLGRNLEAHFDAELARGAARETLLRRYFAGVRCALAAADARIVNLEFPFTEHGTKLRKRFNFRARPELVEMLTLARIDAVTLANNHLMDYGPVGVEDTLDTLRTAGIGAFGAGESLVAARQPFLLERHGLRLGLLGYYFQDRADMLEPRAVYATETSAGVAGCYVDLGCVREQILADVPLLVGRVDAAMVYFHWGKEGSTEVRDYQIELAHACVDLGCRAVFGTHPHRVQGIEVYRGAPIFYSLGNFVYGGIKTPLDSLAAMAFVRVTRSGVAEADVVPIRFTRWPTAPYQPTLLEGAARERALETIARLSRRLPDTLPSLKSIRRERKN